MLAPPGRVEITTGLSGRRADRVGSGRRNICLAPLPNWHDSIRRDLKERKAAEATRMAEVSDARTTLNRCARKLSACACLPFHRPPSQNPGISTSFRSDPSSAAKRAQEVRKPLQENVRVAVVRAEMKAALRQGICSWTSFRSKRPSSPIGLLADQPMGRCLACKGALPREG